MQNGVPECCSRRHRYRAVWCDSTSSILHVRQERPRARARGPLHVLFNCSTSHVLATKFKQCATPRVRPDPAYCMIMQGALGLWGGVCPPRMTTAVKNDKKSHLRSPCHLYKTVCAILLLLGSILLDNCCQQRTVANTALRRHLELTTVPCSSPR
jgi:hypothetical protein